jgi:hypothetical protein
MNQIGKHTSSIAQTELAENVATTPANRAISRGERDASPTFGRLRIMER